MARTDDPRNIEPFLGKVARTALLGRVQDVSEALPITQPQLPASGTAVLRALQQSRDLHGACAVFCHGAAGSVASIGIGARRA
jgi:hypothetical protein